MKTKLTLFVCLMLSSLCFSQTKKETILDTLEASKPNEGTIVVNAESGINELLGTANKRASFASDDETLTKMNGFRILVYMNNDPKKAKSEANNRKQLINEHFIEVETYLGYDSPNWKLLVGDFVTKDEANIFKQLLQKQFPEFGKELYIVSDIINVPVEKK